MSEEIDVLKLVCLGLENANVPYMLTGSVAANFYAVPRMTRDIDIVIEIKQSDAERIFHIFKSAFYIDRDSILEAIKHEGMFNVIHNDSILKIDFIVRKASCYRNTEFQRRRRVHLDNSRIWIVAPEDLILSKLAWAQENFSETQLRDVRNLLLTIKDLDKEYMHHWLDELGLNHLYEKVGNQ